jgi:hypothetical protein
MKSSKLFALFLLLVLPRVGIAAEAVDAGRPKLSVVGAERALDDARELSLGFWLPQLVLTVLYRNVVTGASAEDWQQALASPARIQCRYPTPATLALPERRVLVFDEILLPLSAESYPSFIYLRHGKRYLRVAKYDPWVLHKLVTEAGFSLYANLANVERGLF